MNAESYHTSLINDAKSLLSIFFKYMTIRQKLLLETKNVVLHKDTTIIALSFWNKDD